jgi:hypothetical protein
MRFIKKKKASGEQLGYQSQVSNQFPINQSRIHEVQRSTLTQLQPKLASPRSKWADSHRQAGTGK